MSLNIHTLPIIRKVREVNEVKPFRVMQGLSAETSGGLLMMVEKEKVKDL